MFLCKLSLDPHNAFARRDLADAYEMHSSLARAVVRDAAASPPRFLWRLERLERDTAEVLVQSPVLPDWSCMAGLLDHEEKEFTPDGLVHAGQFCRFRLRANPTACRNGKRHGLRTEEEHLAWLTRQGERNGFTLRACVRTDAALLQTRQRKEGGHRITVQTAGFEGMLAVDDPLRLSQALANGLGHAKALGLGLLSLARGQ